MSNLRKDILIYAAIQSDSDRSRLEDMLVLDRFDISTFASPGDLWEHFRLRQPRIVITDRKFGDESGGLELARKIRKNYTLPYTYILIRSAMERLKDMEEALAAGADDYIIRPHNPLQMRSRVLVASRWVAYMDSLFAGKRKRHSNNVAKGKSMAVQIIESANTQLMEVHLTGKLVKEDYAHFVPAVEQRLKEHGKMRMLVEMHDFHGWTGAAVWEDVKFDVKHFNDIERLAVVGESKWHHGMAIFCKPFTTAKVRYFEHAQIEDARKWLAEA